MEKKGKTIWAEHNILYKKSFIQETFIQGLCASLNPNIQFNKWKAENVSKSNPEICKRHLNYLNLLIY